MNMLSPDNEYLDWKTFLLAAAKPWPAASVEGLLDAHRQFDAIDDLKIGRVGREDFEKVCTALEYPLVCASVPLIFSHEVKTLN